MGVGRAELQFDIRACCGVGVDCEMLKRGEREVEGESEGDGESGVE